ncbi:MAG: hypothetical protein ACFNYI_06040, partial [Eubacterium sp.]
RCRDQAAARNAALQNQYQSGAATAAGCREMESAQEEGVQDQNGEMENISEEYPVENANVLQQAAAAESSAAAQI